MYVSLMLGLIMGIRLCVGSTVLWNECRVISFVYVGEVIELFTMLGSLYSINKHSIHAL